MIDPDEILQQIDDLTSSRKEYERHYLGASEIGDECPRKLWLTFHKYAEPEKFEPRMLRLFQRGKDEELRFETYIHEIGIEIIDGALDQAGFKEGFFSGHGDGVYRIDGKRVAAEMKTHSEKSFAQLRRGNLKQSHPKHYAQCIVYAGKFNCVGALYMAVNKNNDEFFFDYVEFNQEEFDEYRTKAEFITMSDKPPDRICNKPTSYQGKYCNERDVCFGFDLPRVSCKNCTSLEKHQKHGSFGCHKVTQSDSNYQLDKRGWCEDHSFNPYAMNDMYGWEPIEFHKLERAVEYKLPNGETLINGKAPFGIESKDLKL